MIDARGRIVLPGFVDTHRHVWQTALRGIGTDGDLGYYFDRVMQAHGTRYRAEDVAASNLVGALECLDGGITTVQDYSHVQGSAEFAEAAVDALDRSGIRAVFGFGPSPLAGGAVDPDGLRRILGRVSGRIGVAVASIGPAYVPFEIVEADWALAAELGLPVVTHIDSSEVTPAPIAGLRDGGAVAAGHVVRALQQPVRGRTQADRGVRCVRLGHVLPVESRLEMGGPVAARLKDAGVGVGLGIDTVTSGAGDMFSVMQHVLALGHRSFTAAEVLQLATVGGARALGFTDVGSLAVGNQADLIVLRGTDLNLAGGRQDPVATVVTCGHPGNVETVLVGGTPVKRDGQVVSTSLPAALDALTQSAAYLTARAAS